MEQKVAIAKKSAKWITNAAVEDPLKDGRIGV